MVWRCKLEISDSVKKETPAILEIESILLIEVELPKDNPKGVNTCDNSTTNLHVII